MQRGKGSGQTVDYTDTNESCRVAAAAAGGGAKQPSAHDKYGCETQSGCSCSTKPFELCQQAVKLGKDFQAKQQREGQADLLVQPDQDIPSAQQSFLREVNQLTIGASEAPEHDLLADIIRQVPSIMDFLPCKSKKAVLSCSRQCRSVMRFYATAVIVDTLHELEAISSSTWPSLGLVAINNERLTLVASDAIARCKLQILAVFWFSHVEGEYIALILRPSTDQQCLDLAIKKQLDPLPRLRDAIRRQWSPWRQTPWRQCTPWHLNMCGFALRQSQLGSASLTQFFSLSWPKLMYLDLSHTTLDTAAVTALAKADLPWLERISLSCSTLETAIPQLTQKLWPKVTHLYIRGAPSAIPDTTTATAVAAWPKISLLNLEGVQLGTEFGVALGNTHSGLAKLHLLSVPLDADKLFSFMLTAWSLKHLTLQNSELGADAIAVLALCSFPELCYLELPHNQLDDAAAQQVIRGKWPQLQRLNVSFNALDNRAMKALADGQWPHLTHLELQGNSIDAVGLAALVEGHWPKLMWLRLGSAAVSAATWDLLALDPANLAQHNYFKVPRPFDDCVTWHELPVVTFGEHYDSRSPW